MILLQKFTYVLTWPTEPIQVKKRGYIFEYHRGLKKAGYVVIRMYILNFGVGILKNIWPT